MTEPDATSRPEVPSPGRLAQLACLLEVTAGKPGNVHRLRDLPGLTFLEFLLSAGAIVEPLDRAIACGIGETVYRAIEATRRVVSSNTNLGMVLLLAPLAAVPEGVRLDRGIDAVLAATTVADAKLVFRAIRLAQPGGMGEVPDQDLSREPTMALRQVMAFASERDLIARQYVNGFQQVLDEAQPALRDLLEKGRDLETAIVGAYLKILARHPDSLIARKAGTERALEVSRMAAGILDADWPDRDEGRRRCEAFDRWLRDPDRRLNPGTTADLIAAALYAALRDGTIRLPLIRGFLGLHDRGRPG
jgi:triphosphoribosyl-dephospho-CoA synthase